MGFSGGGSNVTKAHTHDSTVVQDGGALAANVTQFGLSSGSILYSDGSNIQELSVGGSSEVLAVSGGTPAWIANTANPLIKVTKTFADIVLAGAYMDIYTLPQDAALVNVWADITTAFDISSAVTIGDAGDDNGFTEATDWTGIGLTDATRGEYITSFKTMRSTSGTTAINAYNFSTSSSAIVKDAQDTTDDTASGTTLTISSFTVASNSNRILIVCTAAADANEAVSGITWNADEDFTRAVFKDASGGATRRAEIWYLVNPTVATADVVTTWGSATVNRGVGVYSYYNVDQTTPLGVTNTATVNGGAVTTGTITPTSAGSLIVDTTNSNTDGLTDTLTAGWTNGVGTRIYGSQYDLSPTIGVSNDMFYTYNDSIDWVWCAAEIKAAVTGSDTQGAVDFYLQVVD